MSTTQLYLVRHGETFWNAEGRMQGHSESSLSERGIAQARARSAEMLAHKFDRYYCSSSERTRQTIHHLLDGAVDTVNYRDDLREILVGPWEGAESFAQLQARGLSALRQIAAKHLGERVLVVSHGGIIKACLLHCLGWPLSQMWAVPTIHNCASSVVEFSAERGERVLSIADVES